MLQFLNILNQQLVGHCYGGNYIIFLYKWCQADKIHTAFYRYNFNIDFLSETVGVIQCDIILFLSIWDVDLNHYVDYMAYLMGKSLNDSYTILMSDRFTNIIVYVISQKSSKYRSYSEANGSDFPGKP